MTTTGPLQHAEPASTGLNRRRVNAAGLAAVGGAEKPAKQALDRNRAIVRAALDQA